VAKAAAKKTSSGKTKKTRGKRAITKPRKTPIKPAKTARLAKLRRKPVKAARAAQPGRKPAKMARMAKPGRKPGKRKPAQKPTPDTAPDLLQKPVASDVKPRKNQAGLTSKQLEHFRDLLLARRRELVGDMSSMEGEALRTSGTSNLSNLPIHMADMGTDNYEQEFTLGLMEKDRNLLRDINSALAKIQSGTFGLCEATGKPISPARLEARPWARFSIEHARSLERGGVR